MKITITDAASRWFESEMDVKTGDGIRFFGKTYGKTAVHDGFSVGMQRDIPKHPLAQAQVDGVNYFVNDSDDWFFNGYDLTVDYDAKLDEPKYGFTAN